jgi:hypothetical protein
MLTQALPPPPLKKKFNTLIQHKIGFVKYRGQVVNAPALIFGGPEYKYPPGDWLS